MRTCLGQHAFSYDQSSVSRAEGPAQHPTSWEERERRGMPGGDRAGDGGAPATSETTTFSVSRSDEFSWRRRSTPEDSRLETADGVRLVLRGRVASCKREEFFIHA